MQKVMFSPACIVRYSSNSDKTEPILMKLGGMIGHDPRNNRLVFGRDWVKGQGHEKVKNVNWEGMRSTECTF